MLLDELLMADEDVVKRELVVKLVMIGESADELLELPTDDVEEVLSIVEELLGYS
jgi:hypothetical protein